MAILGAWTITAKDTLPKNGTIIGKKSIRKTFAPGEIIGHTFFLSCADAAYAMAHCRETVLHHMVQLITIIDAILRQKIDVVQ